PLPIEALGDKSKTFFPGSFAALGTRGRCACAVGHRFEAFIVHRAPAFEVVSCEGCDRVFGFLADHLAYVVLELLLLAGEQLQALFQITAYEGAHLSTVGANDLGKEILTHERFAGVLLLGDHLKQDGSSDVFLRLLVDHYKVDLLHHETPDICERDVSALDGVVQTPIRIFLDYPRLAHGRGPSE